MPKEEKPKVATEKKKRTKKDPNAPKKALSAFMIFSQENRSKIKEANPDASFGQLGKLIGQAWKALDESEKEPYTAKAEQEKERYELAMAAYKEGQ